ncbi:MAG: diguanylate cyclase [Actinomycetota bacterium]|nr:diguanylate cyclase [Actinomycetota bacterium]
MSAALSPRRRLLAVVGPVCGAGFAVVGAAAVSFATHAHETSTFVGLAAFLAASLLADRFPVPVEDLDANGVSLAFVFGVSAIVLFGWSTGVLVVFATPAIMQLVEHRPPMRIAYNASAFAITAGLAGWAVSPLHAQGGPAGILERVGVAASACYVVNLLLITAVVAYGSRRSWLRVIRSSVRRTILPFTLMASAVLMLVVLWEESPFLSVALVGPLLAIQLYQRALMRALRAMRLALTDPLTGLGNHRHFHERLERELAEAREQGLPLSLCFVDVDDFKRINDRFGHPAGDRVLSQLATRLRQSGEAFRLGGDEFALLLPGRDENMAIAAAESIVNRIRASELDQVGHVTVSAGVSAAPPQAQRDEVISLADSALYWAKEYGKDRVRAYRPDVVELAELRRLASGPDRAARFRAAASLAKAVDARDAYTGSHSTRVASLAARVATRLGLDQEEVELTRLAARLHDLGKLALPEELLRKPGPLTEPERLILERHPQIGFRMLESLGIDPVADWVLHHHERWDGTGYPDRLLGERIPLGARIIFVADAYDAMTSERVYRRPLSPASALEELEHCAGTQFDPEVVAAFTEELGVARNPGAVAALAAV